MGQVINTNSLSLLTQNNLNKSQGALNTAIQRLSSGMRINSAKDDAAGQAIANRFTANIKGLTQASRNANDGISLAQTTEGALGEVNTNLQRIRELAVQSANGSNSDADKSSIQAEITQRLEEIDRTSKQTDFNGVKVLSSSAGKLSVQVGANDGESISINLEEISAKTLGLTGFNVDGTGSKNTGAAKSDLLIAGFTTNTAAVNGTQKYDKVTNNTGATSANVFSKLATGDTVTNTAAVTTSLGSRAAGTVFTYNKASDSFSYAASAVTNALVGAALTPTAGGSTAATVTIKGAPSQNVLIAGDGKITAADDNAVLFLTTDGNLSKTQSGTIVQATLANLQTSMNNNATPANSTGGSILANGTTYTAAAGATTPQAVFNVTGAKISAAALKTLADTGGYAAAIATTTATANAPAVTGDTYTVTGAGAVTGTAATSSAAGVYLDTAGRLSGADKTTTSYYEQSNGVVTDGSANVVYNNSAAAGTFTLAARSNATVTADPLKALDAALAKVDTLRGALGAVQNRFDSVISNLGTTITNLTSSRSRIEDADYATEVSNMTRANILQQAGTSVLAQANQSTQGVLSLLR